MRKITLIQPDDWHLHLRDNQYLTMTVAHAAQRFARAIVMPNLKPPVTSLEQAIAYQQRIIAVIPENTKFQPLMTLYLTDTMSPELIFKAKTSQLIAALKLYPAHATTNSAAGVSNIENVFPVLAAMEQANLPLLIHGEVVANNIDVFDREKYFLEAVLIPLIHKFPKLRIVLEHITTKEAVDFVLAAPKNLAATITAHHLLLNRNDMLVGGIRPHYYCLPILKHRNHQEALINAATSGNAKFFLGTDSAPHAVNNKETACGCAGIFTGHAGIELYAEVFAKANALDKLESFASIFGADFYQLPRNTNKITLIEKPWLVPKSLPFGGEQLIPFRAGEQIQWQINNE